MPLRIRRPKYFRYRTWTPRNRAQQVRIRIPQPKDRPLRLEARDATKSDVIRPSSPWWFVVHRRGPKRPLVGIEYQESRAVPKGLVRGTLPERIVYAELVKRAFVPDADFDFQSSLEGGRFELGGMVVDFLFEDLRVALRIQGPTHKTFIRQKKDEEQAQILMSFGFTVLDLYEDIIYDAAKLEDWFRKNLDFLATVRLWPETYTESI